MNRDELTKGEGRAKIGLWVYDMGGDVVVCIFNENAHIGAVAIGEYDHKEKRTSTSVITRLGHRDDIVAQKAAYVISKHTRRSSCVITGIHVDDITEEEIQRILENADALVNDVLKRWEHIGEGGSRLVA